MTRRGKIVLGSLGAVVALGVAAFGYAALTGTDVPIIGDIVAPDPPPPCPLTGQEASPPELVENPVLAVKVENIAEARPQAGLGAADVVFEEPVEGGITRFIAVYQCGGADRIGPVRSARLVDPDILRQYGRPLFAYAGGVDQVFRAIRQADLVDLNFVKQEPLYHKDPSRSAPHNLFISSSEFLDVTDEGAPPADPAFSFDAEAPDPATTKAAKRIEAPFSPFANVLWKWNPKRGVWFRFHDDDRHKLEQGAVSTDNVVVQIVKVRPGAIIDAAGNPSPEIDVIGEGKAYVFRDGRVIEGTWTRASKGEATEYLDAAGEPISLKPGHTWVELFPRDLPFSFS
ncbi:MAG TPA: DUF3048 domain-containing protein [Actinomycetota bacterium]|jgi:hypothetical protein